MQHIHTLEDRRLFSVIPVTPGTDVQRSIDASKAGDVIQFAAGTYRAGALNFLSDRTYAGMPGATLAGDGSRWLATVHPRVTVSGLTFSGAGVQVVEDAKNVHIHGNTFTGLEWRSDDAYPSKFALFMPSGVHDSAIDNNLFVNMADTDTAVIGWGNTNLSIRDNRFDGVNEAIHLFDVTSGNAITHNDIRNYGRMGIEVQGDENRGLLVEFNRLTNPTATSEDGECYGLSIVTGGTGSVVRHNIVVSNIPGKTPYGIEIGGTGTLIEGNYVEGFGTGIVLGQSPKAVLRANTLVDNWLGIDKYPAGDASGSRAESNYIESTDKGITGHSSLGGLYVNDNDIVWRSVAGDPFVGIEGNSTWTVTNNRITRVGSAGSFTALRGVSGSGNVTTTVATLPVKSAPSGTPPVVVTPPPVVIPPVVVEPPPVPQPGPIVALPNKPADLRREGNTILWRDTNTTETAYRVERYERGRWRVVATLRPDSTRCTVREAGTYRIVAVNAVGEAVSNTIDVPRQTWRRR